MTDEQHSQVEDVDVPPMQGPWCPLEASYVSIEKYCQVCEHFRGLAALPGSGDRPFNRKYAVHCGLPTVREIHQMKG